MGRRKPKINLEKPNKKVPFSYPSSKIGKLETSRAISKKGSGATQDG